jgi:hypothetical protein
LIDRFAVRLDGQPATDISKIHNLRADIAKVPRVGGGYAPGSVSIQGVDLAALDDATLADWATTTEQHTVSIALFDSTGVPHARIDLGGCLPTTAYDPYPISGSRHLGLEPSSMSVTTA